MTTALFYIACFIPSLLCHTLYIYIYSPLVNVRNKYKFQINTYQCLVIWFAPAGETIGNAFPQIDLIDIDVSL